MAKKRTPAPRNDLNWKVHTPNLLNEIVKCGGNYIYEKPLQLLGKLLANVGEEAARLNDPRLNALMCRLTIYDIANPESKGYDPERVKEVYAEEERFTTPQPPPG